MGFSNDSYLLKFWNRSTKWSELQWSKGSFTKSLVRYVAEKRQQRCDSEFSKRSPEFTERDDPQGFISKVVAEYLADCNSQDKESI